MTCYDWADMNNPYRVQPTITNFQKDFDFRSDILHLVKMYGIARRVATDER